MKKMLPHRPCRRQSTVAAVVAVVVLHSLLSCCLHGGVQSSNVSSVPIGLREQPPIVPLMKATATGPSLSSSPVAGRAGAAAAITASGFNVLQLVESLDVRLKNIRNVELGVTVVQEIFDAMDFTTLIRNDNESATKIAKRMAKKLRNALAAIVELRNFFVQNMTTLTIANGEDSDDNDDMDDESFYPEKTDERNLFLNTVIQPCPFEDFTIEPNYNKQEIQILNYLKNNGHYDNGDNELTFSMNAKLVEKIRQLNLKTSFFKHIFFLSRSDHASDHTCQYYFNDVQFRHLFVAAIKRKHVFLLIEHGGAFSAEQLELSKSFVTNVINMLSETDHVTIVTITDQVKPMILITPTDLHIYPATLDRKAEMLQFIDNLQRSDKPTNHALGFEYSFQLLSQQNVSTDEMAVEFLYITRGLLSNLNESMAVLRTIARGQRLMRAPIVIDTCAVILDEKRIMYERQFLRDIAQQNYTKFEIDVSDWHDSRRHNITGNMFIVTKRHPERIIKTSTAVFESLFVKKFLSEEVEFHQPVLDYNTRESIIPITTAMEAFGVIGVNLFLSDFAEDVIYYKKSEDSYAFLIDINGIAIFHPAFPRPIDNNPAKGSYPVHFEYLENKLDAEMRAKVLNEERGNFTIVVDGESENKTLSYTWRRVPNYYVVCIVTTLKGNTKIPMQLGRAATALKRLHQSENMSPLELLYHRIDLIPPHTPVCRHFRQIATLDTGTVFLSASAFDSPFAFTRANRENREEITTHNAQSIMAYIKDGTNLLANPGLQPQIRDDVSALYHVMTYLKKRHQQNGPLKKYIIRRYAATVNGVLQVYPGCVIGSDLEASRRPWFRKAIQHPGKIVATEPYLDAGGAGYIITIAHTIFEGKSNALHNAERDQPAAIVAIDVPYAFFYKLILESSPICAEPNIKCLLIEDEGFLIAHPSMLEPATLARNNRRPKEHITHKESFVANDILNHKTLVRKRACANFQNRTIQRYYSFNTSLTAVLTNVVHGERTKYQITAIGRTNLFVTVLNSTCDGGAFCPCSTVDRVCLNCHRMDQTDCECPCECPLAEDTRRLAFCPQPSDEASVAMAANSLGYNWNLVLKSCVNINCDVYATQLDCLAVMGCEWCQLDVDSQPFATPFCTMQSSCFNGVLGAMTPYGDADLGAAIVEAVTPPVYSAIGPVGGAIIALCLVVGFAMYCYRQNIDGSAEQIYCDSMPEDNYGVPLSRFTYDDISPHDESGGGGGGADRSNLHSNLICPLANAIAVPDISPYHMSSAGGAGYRRPPNGESDHGYSTMTPHEDSEHMCFTLVEPLIKNKRLSMSDSMSIGTSVSSPTNQNHSPYAAASGKYGAYAPPGQTTLIGEMSPHHILAPVTVHRHMEAS